MADGATDHDDLGHEAVRKNGWRRLGWDYGRGLCEAAYHLASHTVTSHCDPPGAQGS